MDNVFKIIVVALLTVIIIIQLTSNDVGRYELDNTEIVVFDNKTGKIYTPTIGVVDVLEMSKEQQKKVELRKKREDSEKENIEKAKQEYYNNELSLSKFIKILKTYDRKEVEKVERKLNGDIKRKDIDQLVFLYFESDREARALQIVQYYGDVFTEENNEIFEQMDELNVMDVETYKEYVKMRKKYLK